MRSKIKLFTVVLILILSMITGCVHAQMVPPQPQPPPTQNPRQAPPGQQPGGLLDATTFVREIPPMFMDRPGMMPGMMGHAPTMVVDGRSVFILRADQLLQYQRFENDVIRLKLVDQTTLPPGPRQMAPPPAYGAVKPDQHELARLKETVSELVSDSSSVNRSMEAVEIEFQALAAKDQSQKMKDSLAALGVNLDKLRREVDTLSAQLRALEPKQKATP